MTAIEKCGYIQCQIDISEIIWEREKDVIRRADVVKQCITKETSFLRKQELISEMNKLLGELEGLKKVIELISSLKPGTDSSH